MPRAFVPVNKITRACFVSLLLGLLTGCGAVDAGKALWKFSREFPDVSVFILLDINEDESQVPNYQLPPLLEAEDGEPITSIAQWRVNREYLLAQFSAKIYGTTPATPVPLKVRVIESSAAALNGKALRQQLEMDMGGQRVMVLMYSPLTSPAPAFLALNFRGNHTVSDDPAVLLPESWVPLDEEHGVLTHSATEENRGQRSRRWPIEAIIDRGYAFVTAYYGDFYPDHRDGRSASVHSLFPDTVQGAQWGAIGAWSWGLSRILDYLEQDEYVDASRVVALGHSRLGKAALWAAAQDERFAAVISNNSGAAGAALSRRQFGETVRLITAMFPHWFTQRFQAYSGREDTLPVDQHQLLGLIAPRPVYVASASNDLWADPRGEFLAASNVTGVYSLYGLETASFVAMPAPGGAIPGSVSFHLREGNHDMLAFDWRHFLNFADAFVNPGCNAGGFDAGNQDCRSAQQRFSSSENAMRATVVQ